MLNGYELPIMGIVSTDLSSSTVGITFNCLTTGTANNARTIWCQPEDATITDFGIQLYSSTGTAARELKVQLVDEGGTVIAQSNDYAYDSTSLTYSTTGTLTILPITRDGSGNTISSVNITKGSWYKIDIVRKDNVGWSATNYITVGAGPSNTSNTNDWWAQTSLPTFQQSSTGNAINGMNSVVYSSTKCYGKGYGGHGSQSINSGTTTNYGNRFTLPTGMGSYVSIGGITISGDWVGGGTTTPAPTGSLIFKLWQDNNNGTATELYSFSVAEIYHETGNTFARYVFDAPQTLTTGQKYIITVNNASGTGTLQLDHYTYTDSRENTIFTSNYIPIDGVEISSSGTITAVSKTYHLNIVMEDFINPSGNQALFGGLFNG